MEITIGDRRFKSFEETEYEQKVFESDFDFAARIAKYMKTLLIGYVQRV